MPNSSNSNVVFNSPRSVGVDVPTPRRLWRTPAHELKSSPNSFSNDGSLVTFQAAADLRKGGRLPNSLYLRDRGAGTTRPLINRVMSSGGSVITGNGAVVVFVAYRDDVVTPDTNNAQDIFAFVR